MVINLIKKEWEDLEVLMIDTLHLWWIIPSCMLIGFIIAVWMVSVSKLNRESDIYDEGVRAGMKMADKDYKFQTLRDWVDEEFDSDFKKFKDTTGGVIYGINPYHQMYIIFVDHIDELAEYYDWEIQGISIDGPSKRPMIKELV